MRQAHVQAVLNLLDADNAAPPLVVQDGVVAVGVAAPYVLVYARVARPSAGSDPDLTDLSFDQVALLTTVTCHSVASTAAGARAVGDRVEAALLNVTPSIAQRTCAPIRLVDGQDPQRNEETGVVVFNQADVYEFLSIPG